jgi:hypothetical protein
MQARIIGIRQELSFEDGESASYMIMELPGGAHIQAPIDDETLRALTSSFVNGGGAAAEQAVARARADTQGTRAPAAQVQQAPQPAAHPALANTMRSSPNAVVASNHTPLSVDGEGDSEFVFGGDFSGGDPGEVPSDVDEAELQQLQQQFQQANARVLQAADSGDLGEAVQSLSQPQRGSLPTPSWAAEEVPAQPQPKTRLRRNSVASPVALAAVTVEADAKGNPVLKGAGLVDPYDLTGPTEEQGEAAQL